MLITQSKVVKVQQRTTEVELTWSVANWAYKDWRVNSDLFSMLPLVCVGGLEDHKSDYFRTTINLIQVTFANRYCNKRWIRYDLPRGYNRYSQKQMMGIMMLQMEMMK